MFHFHNNTFLRLPWLWLCLAILTTSALADEYGQEDDFEKIYVEKEKVWFLKETQVAGVTLPLSPLSIFVILLVTIHLVLNWGTYAWCEASHILIKHHGADAKQAIKELKDEIGSDLNKFAEMAKTHSDCPSGRQGGSLGRFYRGDMAKNFDRACFDPNVQTGKAVGPIETSFGWHIIFIEKRSI